jgi:hypothetical protein
MGDGGIFFRFKVGRAGTSAANVRYISREAATGSERENLCLYNYPSFVAGNNYQELRQNLIEYSRQCEEDELHRPRRGRGKPQTHYRALVSFECKVTTDKVMQMVQDYVGLQFPRARIAAFLHRDSEHAHVHLHIQARDINGEKLRWTPKQWRELDKRWGDIYAGEFGLIKVVDHELKKEETRTWKIEYAKRNGSPDQPVPRRSYKAPPAIFKERDLRNYGSNKIGIDRIERAVADSNQNIASSERSIEQAIKASEQLKRCVTQVDRGDERIFRGHGYDRAPTKE